MTKRVLIGAGVATVAAVLLWPRHPQKDAPLPPIEASAPGATVRRPARQQMTEEKQRQVAELGGLIHAVVRADQAKREQTAVVKQAKDKFELATKAYDQERFIDAVEGFRDAYELVPHPDFLYDAGMSYRRAGNCREALFYFDWYLEERPKALESQDPRIADTTPSLASRMAFALDTIRASCR